MIRLDTVLGALAAIMMFVALGGCVDRPDNLTPAGHVYAAQGEFNIALEAATQYSAQPFCSDAIVVACADRDAVIEIFEAAKTARQALKDAETAATLGGGNAALTAAIARTAVATLSRKLLEAQQ